MMLCLMLVLLYFSFAHFGRIVGITRDLSGPHRYRLPTFDLQPVLFPNNAPHFCCYYVVIPQLQILLTQPENVTQHSLPSQCLPEKIFNRVIMARPNRRPIIPAVWQKIKGTISLTFLLH